MGILAVLATTALGTSAVMAGPWGFGKPNADLTAEEIGEMYEKRQAVVDAIESGDFEAWKSLMEQRIEDLRLELTEENFNNLVERHNSMQEMREIKQQIREALESGDYETVEQLRNQLLESAPEGGFKGSGGLRGLGGFHKGGGGCL